MKSSTWTRTDAEQQTKPPPTLGATAKRTLFPTLQWSAVVFSRTVRLRSVCPSREKPLFHVVAWLNGMEMGFVCTDCMPGALGCPAVYCVQPGADRSSQLCGQLASMTADDRAFEVGLVSQELVYMEDPEAEGRRGTVTVVGLRPREAYDAPLPCHDYHHCFSLLLLPLQLLLLLRHHQ
jgi:hypothetical protein